MLGPVGMLTHPARKHTAKSGNNLSGLSVMIFLFIELAGALPAASRRDNF
jgi:hypothetical protein